MVFEEKIEKLMGCTFEQFCETVTQGMKQEPNFLCYGAHGKIDFAVKKFAQDDLIKK